MTLRESVESQLKDPAEWVGFLAMFLGCIGAVSNLKKAHATQDVKSYSLLYLVTCVMAESLFALQGYMKGSFTLTFVRLTTTAYFAYFLYLYLKTM